MMDCNRHVALYLPSLRGGGAEQVMVNLANGFAKRGIRTDLVLAKAEGPYLGSVSGSVNIIDLHSRRVLTSLPALVFYLRKVRPDVMLATVGHANVIAIMARVLSGTRHQVRLVVRETTTVGINASEAPTWRGRVMPLVLRFFYPMADAIIANSMGAAKNLSIQTGIPEDRILIIGNPVDIGRIRKLSMEPLAGVPKIDAGPVIVSVGRLAQEKDFETLLYAFKAVHDAMPDVRLLILGEGELRQKLETLASDFGIADRVALPGFLSNPYPVMKHADLFVLSSRWEGLPNALLEALALGVPIVATNCPSGPAEILEDGKYGKLVTVGDTQAMADAIVGALGNSPDMDILIKRAEDFSVDKIVDQYLKLIFPG